MKIDNIKQNLNYILVAMIPGFLVITLFLSIPAFLGGAIITGNLEPYVLAEPTRTEFEDLFKILFPVFQFYNVSLLVLFMTRLVLEPFPEILRNWKRPITFASGLDEK